MANSVFCLRVSLARFFYMCALAAFIGGNTYRALAQVSNTSPVLLTDAASTRAIAFDSATWRAEPFPLVSPIRWGADERTRVMLFAMNLELLSGEGANALTVDAEDSARRRYPLKVEFVGQVPDQPWLYAVVVRLHDEMGDPGDVLIRINLHGMSSNRARIAVGHRGGGPPDDSGAVPSPAPATTPAPTPTPTINAYNGPATESDTVRFLEQASFGPTPAEVARVKSVGFRTYLNEQFATSISSYPTLPLMPSDGNIGCPQPQGSAERNICVRDNYSMYPVQLRFFQNALYGGDQLGQRVAFALSQIFVVSGRDVSQPSWMTHYLQTLDQHAFGNFRDLLHDVTLNPGMGVYLDMAGNAKANPNENYARECLQLFTTGLYELNADGTLKLDAQNDPIPTYDQAIVTSFARVFTGWNLAAAPTQGVPNYKDPMVVARESNHDANAKTLLNGVTLPAGQTSSKDLNDALDNIFNHPNVGPFTSKQLIQHLVTSNPSPAYVGRAAAAFNNNGAGVRGDMKAVVAAILLDPEARGQIKTDPDYGHLREPAQLIANVLRAFNARAIDGTTTSDGYLNPQSVTMDQDVFRSPSVFNFYPPDYEVPGTGILGPAFKILSTSTALKRANFVNTIVYSGIARGTNAPNGTSLDLSAMQSLAGDPAQLVEALNKLLLHGAMSTSVRSTITQAVANMPGATDAEKLKRAQTAVYLVATSSQYQVER